MWESEGVLSPFEREKKEEDAEENWTLSHVKKKHLGGTRPHNPCANFGFPLVDVFGRSPDVTLLEFL